MGIEVARSKFGIFMSQRRYVLDILEEISIIDYKHVATPMDLNVKLIPRLGAIYQIHGGIINS